LISIDRVSAEKKGQ